MDDRPLIKYYYECFGKNIEHYNGKPIIPIRDVDRLNAYLLKIGETMSLDENLSQPCVKQNNRVFLCNIDEHGWIEVDEKSTDKTHYGVIAMDRSGDSSTDDLYIVNGMIYEVHPIK
jgi:hypothetical protein